MASVASLASTTAVVRCTSSRRLSLPRSVAAAGGLAQWNQRPHHRELTAMIRAMVTAKTKEEASAQVNAMIDLDHSLWAYLYMRMLMDKDLNLAYSTILYQPAKLLPIMYTPTVGEACQKFGKLPLFARGCYVCIEDRGNIKAVLAEYARSQLPKMLGKPICDCIVFSDGGRILGLGDLGAWGMGIPIGKLDLYTACGGFNPHRTMPVIIDAGCGSSKDNTAHLVVRDSPDYTGMRKDRVKHRSKAGTLVNSAYYGRDSIIDEFMTAARDLFGARCLMQFEDFNSNDAFPLLEEYRTKFLTYNDDIQGTAAISVAGILGAIKLKNPQTAEDLIGSLCRETFLFHGAGSANLGAASLLIKEGRVPADQVFITNSRGLIWRSEDGKDGSFRNDEQKEFATVGKPSFDSKSLVAIIESVRPSCIVGAVGVAPNCFKKEVFEALLKVNRKDSQQQQRPIVFALSNPKTQAECTAEAAYRYSEGHAIFGTGTYFDPVEYGGRTYAPGQVNNVYIFPGVSFGACVCAAKTIPDRLFMVAAGAVASCLNDEDSQLDRVVPARERLREVGLEVAAAVALEAQHLGVATRTLGQDLAEVKAKVKALMWEPGMPSHFGIPAGL